MQAEQTDPRPRMRPWLRVLLVLSLAFNLVIIGAAAGLALRFGRAGPPPFLVEGPGSPMVMALSHEHRRAVGRSIRRAYHEAEDGRRARAASYRDLAGVLEAEPLDLA
uniref:periplasmic heavy metal sensor n=1 Tax=Shimia sp. TaxID=1954381 RepID=UPI003569FCF9